MARRGRPPDTDSAETRRRIIDVARVDFATKGYDATAISAVTTAAGLAPTAIYHYFGGKQELYEAVFEETTDRIWNKIGTPDATSHATLREAIAALVTDTRASAEQIPHHSAFIAMVPVEARLHPEFAHLRDRRSSYLDARFEALAHLGLATGELDGFTHREATEILRALVMGWFFERHLRDREIEHSTAALLALLDRLAARRE